MALDLTTFADLFSFSRSGTATYLDASGVLQTAADGVARTAAYRYVNGVLTGPSLRLESAAATNLTTYSEDFTSWTFSDASASANVLAAPDGATTADKIVEAATTSNHYTYLYTSVTGGVTYTFSFFAKAAERSFVQIAFNSTISGSAYANINLSDGSVGNSTGITPTVTAFPNDWYLIQVSIEAGGSGTSGPVIALLNGDTATRLPSYTGDGTSGLYLWGAQFEEGSIPTSYIPTSGATATRSAETLTIAAADMPDYQTPTYIGSELVTNGTFDTDTDWTKGTGWTISGGVASFDASVPGAGVVSDIYQNITTTSGNVYYVSIDFSSLVNVEATDVQIKIDDGGTAELTSITSDGTYTLAFVAAASTTKIAVRMSGATEGDETGSIDNISVREINPLSVCFQMSGTMNYADTGVATEIRFLFWRADASNLLAVDLSTAAGNTGQLNFDQLSGGVVDSVDGPMGSYSPGLNVSFNIASRHGANFINGAVDGTALTENTTPTGIADLSAADFEVGPTFNGHIDQLLIWNEDIGDTGIAEASQ